MQEKRLSPKASFFSKRMRTSTTQIFTPQTHVDSKIHLFFCILLLIDICLLLFMIDQTSIYHKEAQSFFANEQFAYHLANLGVDCLKLFTNNPLLNDYGLRLPFVCIHIINCILMYQISLIVLKKAKDALLCVVLFMAIPGVSIESLIVSNVGMITLASLLLVYYQLRYDRIFYPSLLFVVFLDSGGAILCLALFFYALLERKTKTLLFSMICFGINMSIFSPIHGAPKTYLLDILGLLAIVFTPALFVYYIATLYSYTIHNKPILLNLIPFIGFIFIFILSTRQQIRIESFLPPLSVGLPLVVKKTLFDFRCRLPRFRLVYYFRFFLIILFLLLGNLGLFGNKLTYLFIGEHHRNFAYPFYGAKEIATQLYERKITTIEIPNRDLALRLKFYGINTDTNAKYRLEESKKGDIKVIYYSTTTAQYRIVKK